MNTYLAFLKHMLCGSDKTVGNYIFNTKYYSDEIYRYY